MLCGKGKKTDKAQIFLRLLFCRCSGSAFWIILFCEWPQIVFWRLLCPVFPIERAELDGLRDMRREDILASRKIGNRAGDAQDSIISAGGKSELVECFFEKRRCRGIGFTEFSDLRGRKRCIAVELFFIFITAVRENCLLYTSDAADE